MLSPAQLEARAGKFTASHAGPLMRGEVVKIKQHWLELTGQAQPEDMRQVWPVRLGEATEPLHIEWIRMSGLAITRCGEVVVHPQHSWLAATLDGWCEELTCPVEVKHVGGREPLEVVIDRYQPQLQCQMAVTGASQCLFSVIAGASPPIMETIERDDAYIAEMLKRILQFMESVWAKRPPVELPAVPAPVDASKVYDFSSNNMWVSCGADWLLNKDAAKVADEASKILKSIVPTDAKRVHGGGIQITRNKAGALSLREAS